MTEPTLTLRCSGRPVDDFGRPAGEICGTEFKRPPAGGDWRYISVTDIAEWVPRRTPIDDAAYLNRARAAGWSVGPNREAMCPKCRRPSSGVLRDVAAIERSLR